MMKSIKTILILLSLSLLGLPVIAHAQEEACPMIVREALEVVDQTCNGTGRNQACYGNITLLAEPHEGVADFEFSTPGDLVNVSSVQTLTLSSYNEDTQEWGVSLMRLQANLPATLPGTNVTFVLFGDVEIENAVEPAEAEGGDGETTLTPFQAFFFRSGFGDAACSVAPDSGIEIQTPDGEGEVELTVNEVQIILASTVYLQAQADGEMTINVVEGQATVEAFDVAQVAPAGSRVRVPLDEDLRASGPPNPPEPYDESKLQALPISLLPLPITVAAALTAEEIEAAQASTTGNFDNIPIAGVWSYVEVGSACGGVSIQSIVSAVTEDSFTLDDVVYPATQSGVYGQGVIPEENPEGLNIRVIAPDHMEVEYLLHDWSADRGGWFVLLSCQFEMELVRAAE